AHQPGRMGVPDPAGPAGAPGAGTPGQAGGHRLSRAGPDAGPAMTVSCEVRDMTEQRPGVAEAGAQGPVIQRADGTPIRVLVVDDEPSLAELLASVLRYEGWEIKTAGDGASAVRAAREFRPDAVVLDIMLPDFDGLEVLRRVRSELPHVCVLFLTA